MSTDLFETAIVKIEPNEILIRGYPIEQLIGKLGYAGMVLLEILGELPNRWQARLLEAILVAGCDHSFYAPSIGVARIAATCGITSNSCIATGMNVLGDIHGGAGEQTMKILYSIAQASIDKQVDPVQGAIEYVRQEIDKHAYIPGFGHGQHTKDPRVVKLLEVANLAKLDGAICGQYIEMAIAMERELSELKRHRIPINIDGISGAIQCEIGLPSEVAKGLFCLSRGIGLVAHVYEEQKGGARLKSVVSHDARIKYTGVARRDYLGETY